MGVKNIHFFVLCNTDNKIAKHTKFDGFFHKKGVKNSNFLQKTIEIQHLLCYNISPVIQGNTI